MNNFTKRLLGLYFVWLPVVVALAMIVAGILMAWPGDSTSPEQAGAIESLIAWAFLIIPCYVMGTEILNQVER